ncbi:MAG: zinc-binding dehydrogenase [Firmicutes bacterium]|nr:zinc-binding dehydrogenase [Bacillota bacterium]
MLTRSAVLKAPGRLELAERRLELHEDEVLVKTHIAGVCGSDKMYFEGKYPPGTKLPFYLGHEGGGTVAEVGSRVSGYKPGDRVICFGWHNTFADYFAAPAISLQPVPDGLDMTVASLGEPLGCAMFSAMQSGLTLGDRVAVFGTGFAGLVMIQCLKKMGASRMIAVDLIDGRLEMAGKMGADVLINPGKVDVVSAIMDKTEGKGVEVAVEAAGAEDTMNWATASLRHNGKLVLYSWITRPVTLNISRWHQDSFDIRATGLVHHTNEERHVWVPRILAAMTRGSVDFTSLITHEFPLEKIQEAVETANTDPRAVKVIIRP